ncbi:hypothetical protein Nepgr_003158 [Nepenthes gracilis]|uniref:TORTIFOLIA1/SINE1-2 N-terminal domain-containing protein n=1 Tax=Nepenthes gracilis TaxID=150966 RepID=A0AAD3XD18_NEPGR|nr:hypothetical protein Nepgr_003158 [Nepenthes gracilis]
MAPPKQASSRDLRHRVLTCLTKLSDRDTQSLAANELESIIPTLTSDTFSLFINSLSSTSTTDKSTVRATSLRLLGELSAVHSNSLSPYLPKLLNSVLRRLRDPDSAVRSACVSTVASFASHITNPPFSSILRPLADSLSTEQDISAQSASALCLSAAVNASPEPDADQILKLLPKWMKLLKCDSFKAKSSLLALIRSVVGVVQIGNCNLLKDLVTSLVEFLKSEDWAARKAAAEALSKVAVVEREALPELKAMCLRTLESRKFDKVKAAREAMNQMVEAWKEIPDVSDDGSPPPHSNDSSKENASDGRYPPGPTIPSAVDSNTPQSRKMQLPVRRSSPSDTALKTTARNRGTIDNAERRLSPPIFRKLDRKKPSSCKAGVSNPCAPSLRLLCGENQVGDEESLLRKVDKGSIGLSKPELKRGLFANNSGSPVVTYTKGGSESTVVVSNTTAEICRSHKDCEDLSLIRNQLVQIEKQQSSLMDLLQKFIGSSQNGMRSLETRVHGLELALDSISYDLAVSTARTSSYDPARTSCCLLPGSGFLKSKLWKRAEGHCSTSQLSFSGKSPSVAAMQNMAGKSATTEPFKHKNMSLVIRCAAYERVQQPDLMQLGFN